MTLGLSPKKKVALKLEGSNEWFRLNNNSVFSNVLNSLFEQGGTPCRLQHHDHNVPGNMHDSPEKHGCPPNIAHPPTHKFMMLLTTMVGICKWVLQAFVFSWSKKFMVSPSLIQVVPFPPFVLQVMNFCIHLLLWSAMKIAPGTEVMVNRLVTSL